MHSVREKVAGRTLAHSEQFSAWVLTALENAMKRREAECILAALSGYETAMSALAAMVSLTDAAKHMGYESVAQALNSLKKYTAQQDREAATKGHSPTTNGVWRPLTHVSSPASVRTQAAGN